MCDVLRKFPSTPHLAWLGRGPLRDDKLLTPAELRSFLAGAVVVEEKVDGANLGLSFDEAGELRLQNRGHWLKGKLTGQWERLRGWAATHEARLRELLPARHIVFGEWCYATHSIRYDFLPDWLLVFDVFDEAEGRFWSAGRRNALAAAANLAVVPAVARGMFTLEELQTLLEGRSVLTQGPREGLYLRREGDFWLERRAKLVRPEFTQSIVSHWSRAAIAANTIRAVAAASP